MGQALKAMMGITLNGLNKLFTNYSERHLPLILMVKNAYQQFEGSHFGREY